MTMVQPAEGLVSSKMLEEAASSLHMTGKAELAGHYAVVRADLLGPTDIVKSAQESAVGYDVNQSSEVVEVYGIVPKDVIKTDDLGGIAGDIIDEDTPLLTMYNPGLLVRAEVKASSEEPGGLLRMLARAIGRQRGLGVDFGSRRLR